MLGRGLGRPGVIQRVFRIGVIEVGPGSVVAAILLALAGAFLVGVAIGETVARRRARDTLGEGMRRW